MTTCFHKLKKLIPPEPSNTPNRPYRYQCLACGAKLKIASGVILSE